MTSEIKVDTISEQTSANGVSIDGVTLKDGGITVQSTDASADAGPVIVLDRASGSPADDDLVGRIIFRARDDGGNAIDLVKTNCFLTDASDGSEDATFEIDKRIAGTYRSFLSMTPSEIVLNDDSQDIDFRVESNSNTHMLFVDGGNNRVGIGTTPDLGVGLHIRTSDSGATVSSTSDELVIEGSSVGMSFLDSTSGATRIAFGDSGDNDIGKIVYGHSSDQMEFVTGGAARFTLVGGDAITAAINSDATTDTTVALNLLKASESASTASRMLSFEVGGQGRGFILNGTGDSSNPAFGAGSDRRLKKNITAYTGGYDKIKSVPVQTWDEQFTDATGLKGWIADELETVFPEAVTGTKDATRTVTNAIISEHGNCLKQNVTEEEFDELKGKEIYKNCTWSASKVVPAFQLSMPDKLFPDVVQALQAAITKIETLETKVKALEDA